jgi:hypothetical protein
MPDHVTTLIRAMPGHLRVIALVVVGVVALAAVGWVVVQTVRYVRADANGRRVLRTMWRIRRTLWLAKTLILLSEVHDIGGHVALAGQEMEQATVLLSKMDSREADQLLLQLEDMRSVLPTDTVAGSLAISD